MELKACESNERRDRSRPPSLQPVVRVAAIFRRRRAWPPPDTRQRVQRAFVAPGCRRRSRGTGRRAQPRPHGPARKRGDGSARGRTDALRSFSRSERVDAMVFWLRRSHALTPSLSRAVKMRGRGGTERCEDAGRQRSISRAASKRTTSNARPAGLARQPVVQTRTFNHTSGVSTWQTVR